MFKASLSGDGDVVDLSEVLEGLKISKKQFQEMCIAAGCDYLKNIRGVGIARAFQLATTGGDILEALVQRGADETYQANFHKAMAVFHYQTVFDVNSCSTVPLEKWDIDPSMDVQYLCGYNLDYTFAKELAAGNVNTKNLEKVNSFPVFTKVAKRNESGGQLASSTEPTTNADTQNKHLEIIHVERHSTICWKIPCFPVLAMEFTKLHYKQGTETKDGFVQKTMASELKQGEYLCTSHCEIEIERKSYTVLWEIKPEDRAVTFLPNPQSAANDYLSDEECNEDVESDESEETREAWVPTSHCLPFKVLGTCYTSERQKALEESYEYLYEHNIVKLYL
ncbi:uncharacterized protein [Montipora capricornis]|uniref:uncharacterized protein n=1 Tax=Montipora capricornis TaxID=246305 RepID=UPI0035F1C155